MRRREFITVIGGAVAAWPLAARAQQSSRMPSIGVLLAEDDQGMQERLAGLRQGLDRLGWSDGRNIRLVYRFCEGKPDRFQPLAKELVAMQCNLIVALARRLAVIMHRVWVDGTEFRWTREVTA